ncbi:hypothetical protein [Chelatococcus asaccharovorans]|uniref:Uncharacterized protein n=1 Tax=Chelatococcus asaccharovorans TaxID=28210 RepID=A0A2V3TTT7_9HYPH|nr:hypothetical protein [Chelatococcus asaccharovorans]MBS7707901.1 hypothetical protein [Chelatococcus asaccharovorans]PXW51151.1 hypothetical protein C7450_12142 [Chelatococcus asaccharovorans]PZR85420.1 MAG: hypothetical protein DI537_30825 [Stutzerimonas stutzeri]
MVRIFVDMDGVLANFDAHHEAVFGIRPDKKVDNVNWQQVRDHKGFYAGIPPMDDMMELWNFVTKHDPYRIVLTGIPYSVEEAESNKRGWIAKHLGDHVEVRCCKSRDKSLHAEPGDILIDDWDKYRHLWVKRGGTWITHTSATNTIAELTKIFGD